MSKSMCPRCGNNSMTVNFISVGCPICGERVYLPDADEGRMWSEHKDGLMYRRGGWRWLGTFEPPAWFLAEVI